jgi:hypothetical protein
MHGYDESRVREEIIPRIKKHTWIETVLPGDQCVVIRTVEQTIVSVYRDEDKIEITGESRDLLLREFHRELYRQKIRASQRAKVVHRSRVVRARIRAAGYQDIREEDCENPLGRPYRVFHMQAGVQVIVHDSGPVHVGPVDPRFATVGDCERHMRLRELLACFLPSRDGPRPTPTRSSHEPEQSWLTAQSWIDPDGYPIPLPGTDQILAMGPPPPPPKVWENPKTLSHMCNRLRSLGYRVKATSRRGWVEDGEWEIKLATGPTINFKEGGEITLAGYQRDYRLERLFKIDGLPD